MATWIETTEPGDGAAGRWPDRERILGRYYAGEPLPCPVGCGGVAEVVRTGSLAHGGGEVWVECGSCAQRVRYPVPGASDGEREAVARDVAAGADPTCPRHVERVLLERRGQQRVCPGCGVRYLE